MAGITTGASVIGIAFEGGVLVAADTLVSYGSMAKYKDCERIMIVNNTTVVAASGDYADYQFLTKIIKQKQIDEKQWNDGLQLYPAALHSWITRVSYNKRSKFEPLWCAWVVAGLQPNENTGKSEPFLGFVDKLGTSYKSSVISTGFGSYLATPLIRELTESLNRLPTEEEARSVITKAMEVLYYRDCRAHQDYHLVVIKQNGITREGPIKVQGNWNVARFVHGY